MNVNAFLFENICVFVVKTKGYNPTVLTYVYVCVCLRNQRTKTAVYVFERNRHAENRLAKRQETCKKKEVISESVEYIGIHIT